MRDLDECFEVLKIASVVVERDEDFELRIEPHPMAGEHVGREHFVELEKNPNEEVIKSGRVLDARYERSESALTQLGHRVGPRRVQRIEHAFV